ncbi:MAG: hypothetical protein PVH12_06395 [Candidatus Bathyarchaeota archaeon]
MNVSVRVAINNLSAVKLAEKVQNGESISFDVKARMEERERRSSLVDISFALNVGTRPSIAKFEVEGLAQLQGKDADINKMLEVDPETQIPYVFQRVYQHLFTSMYLLATLIDVPYPPANLLLSQQQPTAAIEISKRTTTQENLASQNDAEPMLPEEEVSTTTPEEKRAEEPPLEATINTSQLEEPEATIEGRKEEV